MKDQEEEPKDYIEVEKKDNQKSSPDDPRKHPRPGYDEKNPGQKDIKRK